MSKWARTTHQEDQGGEKKPTISQQKTWNQFGTICKMSADKGAHPPPSAGSSSSITASAAGLERQPFTPSNNLSTPHSETNAPYSPTVLLFLDPLPALEEDINSLFQHRKTVSPSCLSTFVDTLTPIFIQIFNKWPLSSRIPSSSSWSPRNTFPRV